MSVDSPHVVIINPGSTSTKIALAKGEVLCQSETLRHDVAILQQYAGIWKQFPYRLEVCSEWCEKTGVRPDAVVARGGLLRPLEGGTYNVSEKMLDDARRNIQGEHASNLGCALAFELAERHQCPAFIVDPVSVDEFEPLARYSGHPLIERKSLSHALNMHAVARRAATDLGKPFAECDVVVAHIGGGISVAPVRGGRIIDVNDASSDGPFSSERSGGLPLQQLISLCFSGTYSETELREMVRSRGGLLAYLGTNDLKEVERRIANADAAARQAFEAMAYQIAKEIGAMSTVLNGNVDAILFTGGGAYSKILVALIEQRVRFIAPVRVYAGEDEMAALAEGALRVLRGDEEAKEY
ncbi:MAG: butyrate kinase [Ignavibacteriae bacterium]|nr:butyrate kinase [Ignavibacteriota bacterium]